MKPYSLIGTCGWWFGKQILVISSAFLLHHGVVNADGVLLLQSTTSTVNSGLLDEILPVFTSKTGIQVKVISSGTGQALRNARNGDADLVLVHSKFDEEKFIEDGHGVKRVEVMFNDFVIVGPPNDSAGIQDALSVVEAFVRIAETESRFVSRGDDSGTHKREISIWKTTEIPLDGLGSAAWYMETGSGMGSALNIAVNNEAYILSDRGTWINFRNKRRHKILFQRDKKLLNRYSAILVSKEKHPHVNSAQGQVLIDWLISKDGREAINAYQIGGEQLFFSDSK